MKKLLMLCLVGMAAAAMAAETPIELKTKKNIIAWGSKKYYETVNVTVENGVAKVAVGKTVPDAKPDPYQFGALTKSLKGGVNYKLTFTVKSNANVRLGYTVLLSQKPWTHIAKKVRRAELTADTPQTLEVQFTPQEDIAGWVRVPGLSAVLKEGQTLELSDVKLAEMDSAK